MNTKDNIIKAFVGCELSISTIKRTNKGITIGSIENTSLQLWTFIRMNKNKDNSKQNKKLTNNKINKITTMVQAQLVSDGAI